MIALRQKVKVILLLTVPKKFNAQKYQIFNEILNIALLFYDVQSFSLLGLWNIIVEKI